MEQTTIDERIFIWIEISIREGKVMATINPQQIEVMELGFYEKV